MIIRFLLNRTRDSSCKISQARIFHIRNPGLQGENCRNLCICFFRSFAKLNKRFPELQKSKEALKQRNCRVCHFLLRQYIRNFCRRILLSFFAMKNTCFTNEIVKCGFFPGKNYQQKTNSKSHCGKHGSESTRQRFFST